jgi:hypothetical protein
MKPILLADMLLRAHADEVDEPDLKSRLIEEVAYFDDLVLTLVAGLAERGLLDADGMIRLPEPDRAVKPEDVAPKVSLIKKLDPVINKTGAEFDAGQAEIERQVKRGKLNRAQADQMLEALRRRLKADNPVLFNGKLDDSQIGLDPIAAIPDLDGEPDDDMLLDR